MGAAILISFLTLMFLAVPIAFALGITGALGIYTISGNWDLLAIVPQELYRSLDSFPLLTIPLFIFAGGIMAQGGVAKRLMALAEITVGRGRGGLGAAVVASTMMFSGISGSSTADTAAIGRVALPILKQQGYPLPFSTALMASAGGAALLIPPTIDLIIIGIVANISIAGLFAAGIIPALINGFGLALLVIFLSRRGGYGGAGRSASLSETFRVFLSAIPALLMMALILGGILFGVFTPTEASAAAVAYGLFVSVFIYRDLRWSMLPQIIRSTVELSGLVLFIIAMGGVFSYAMTIGRVPNQLAAFIVGISDNPVLFLLLVQALFLFLGTIMDGTPAILILMPILTPIAARYGIEPIHFGILVEANIALGLVTPPVGLCLYAACAIADVPLERVIRPVLPMVAILIVTMLLITYVEGFSMFLPRLLNLTR